MEHIDLIYKRAEGYQWSHEGKVKNLSEMTHSEILEALMNSLDIIAVVREQTDDLLAKVERMLERGK
jgi:hypothetical protein